MGGVPGDGVDGGINPNDFSIVGPMLSGLEGRTESNIRASLNEQVKNNGTLTSFSQKVFAGINPTLGMVAGIIDAIVRQIIQGVGEVGENAEEWIEHLLSNLNTFYHNLGEFLGSINFLSPDFNPAAAAQEFVELMLLPLNLLLGPNSPLNLANAFGNLTRVNIGAISRERPNLVQAGTFPLGSIATNSDWELVGTGRTDDGTGSVKVTADGYHKALRTGRNATDTILVGEGQTFDWAFHVSWTGYSGAGEVLHLQVVPYIEGVPQVPVNVAALDPEESESEWPGVEVAGSWTVPENVTGVQMRILLTSDALAGTFFIDDVSGRQDSTFRLEWVDGLPEAIQDMIARWQSTLNTIFTAVTGVPNALAELADIAEALASIPFKNIQGVLGPGNIGGSLIEAINALVGGLVGQPGEGASIADLFNIGKLVSSMASQGRLAWEKWGQRNNKPVAGGLLPSSSANYEITSINTSLEARQDKSLIGVIRVTQDMPLGLISWLGYGSANLDAFYVNIWYIDPTDGTRDLIHHSPNLVGDLVAGTTVGWHFYSLAEGDIPGLLAGEDYAIEFVPVGTGTHYIRGMSRDDDIPDHPYAQVVGLAATRDNTTSPDSPPATIAKASWVSSGEIPWFCIAVDTGNDVDYHDPLSVPFNDDGQIAVPRWAKYVDVIGVGGGGGSRQGGTVGFYGEPGEPGKWNATTWVRGIDFSGDTVFVNLDIGDGGYGGQGLGSAGADTIITLNEHTLTCEGGDGGTSLRPIVIGGNPYGLGAGEFTYNDVLYKGGLNQQSYSGAGSAPGGAAMGGNWILFSPGAYGGKGAAWVVFRSAAPGEATPEEPDPVEPPEAPTVTVVSTSYHSIKIAIEA
ncbi:minor tail protein [Mycobacterium phage Cosmo]|uniref:Minor tail protein n=1 Tax=Mycobacterium phage Cosmo TaxID=1567467 RepID=A0A0B5A365_9CAUD|nr:minor tail protein [Mycobacterium phage Cosmo]